MHTFIHPTKTGGTTIETFLRDACDKNVVTGQGHDARCTHVDNPIVVVRDPYARARSIYKFWKLGSPENPRTGCPPEMGFAQFWQTLYDAGICEYECDHVHPPGAPTRFCGIELPAYMWHAHLLPQSWWFPDGLEKVIVNDEVHLRDNTFRVLDQIGSSYDPSLWKSVNVSNNAHAEMDASTQAIIDEIYAADLNMWNEVSS